MLSKKETHELFKKLNELEEKARPAKDEEREVSHGRYELAARLQYGAGLRLSELVRLRIQDVDLDRGMLTVRQGKGDKDRVTVLPKSLQNEIAKQIERAREIWQGDREAGLAGVYMPGALARKFRRAAETFEWFWLFITRSRALPV